ncbi:MAG: 2-hydroxyacid dehydrogenase [Vibrio fluvialis]
MSDEIILTVGPLMAYAVKLLTRSGFEVASLPEDATQVSFLKEYGNRVRAVALARVIDETLINALPNLGLIANFGVGYDNVPVALCVKRKILVAHTPHVLTDDVADTAVALALMTIRQFGQAERYLRAGRWVTEGMFPLSGSLSGASIGILGYGRIGQAVAQRLSGFPVAIRYHDLAPTPDATGTYVATSQELAHQSDVLIAVLPGGEATRGIIDHKIFEALGTTGIFINVGRGTAVNQDDLIAALEAGTIRAAGLDVYASEPDIPASLIAMDHVVLLPHVASGSETTRKAMADLFARNITEFMKTGQALTPVPETPNSLRSN